MSMGTKGKGGIYQGSSTTTNKRSSKVWHHTAFASATVPQAAPVNETEIHTIPSFKIIDMVIPSRILQSITSVEAWKVSKCRFHWGDEEYEAPYCPWVRNVKNHCSLYPQSSRIDVSCHRTRWNQILLKGDQFLKDPYVHESILH